MVLPDSLMHGHAASSRVTEATPAWDKTRTRALFQRWTVHHDREAREQLIVSHLNLVRFLASRFKNRGESLEDLIQVGTIGLIKAIDRFEPARGLEFTTYATPTIMGEIKRYFRDKGWSVKVPRRLQELSAKVNQTTDELTSELNRQPSVAEIAERLEATVEEVLEAMESSSAYSAISLDARPTADEEESPTIMERYAIEDETLTSSDDRMLLEAALKDFSPREQEVITMRFTDGMTQVEIAERMGVSQVQVSRLLRRCLKRIHDKIEPPHPKALRD